MSRNVTTDALPYREPGPVSILTLTSFFLLLNLTNHVVDRVLYVGLLGQVFIGIAWGTPGWRWLDLDTEVVCVNLGYLGLLLLVFEGGLNTSFKSLTANFWLSLTVATTGVVLPIALSFILVVLAGATPLQAFAAGAALCSTSLGTTFTVIQSSGLKSTRMGVVLTVAAMMDDVVGLVMVRVISKLGPTSAPFNALTIVRPVLVSIALGVLLLVACHFFVLPFTIWLNELRVKHPASLLSKLLILKETAFILHTLFLVGMIAGATYAGTSNLLAAYLTGTAISWWDSEVPHGSNISRTSTCYNHDKASPGTEVASPAPITMIKPPGDQKESTKPRGRDEDDSLSRGHKRAKQRSDFDYNRNSGLAVFETYYHQPLQRVLKPLFFASIGFAIPIRRMFASSVVWRGVVYTLLMILSKIACGLWLIRMTMPIWLQEIWPGKPNVGEPETKSPSIASEANKKREGKRYPDSQDNRPAQQAEASSRLHATNNPSSPTARTLKPVSIYPGAILGCAMVARGEIGFLISSLAEANGVFGQEANGELFLIVTWAIMLCTIIGPLFVGIILRRLRRISKRNMDIGKGRQDALGVWGVIESSIRTME